jgi:hypothetical protein
VWRARGLGTGIARACCGGDCARLVPRPMSPVAGLGIIDAAFLWHLRVTHGRSYRRDRDYWSAIGAMGLLSTNCLVPSKVAEPWIAHSMYLDPTFWEQRSKSSSWRK